MKTTMEDGRGDAAWQSGTLVGTYLDGVRGAIPLAREQIDILARLAQAAVPNATAVLDLGCGDGILGHALLDAYGEARPVVVLADFSPPMLDAARGRLSGHSNARFLVADYADRHWTRLVTAPPLPNRYDVIVSGFSIHHQHDEQKRRIYGDVFDLLTPGGIFLNLEHVASASRWGEIQFETYFIDALHHFHAPRGKTRDEVAADFYHRPDKAANRLTLVETQCEWLRDIGFANVDCYFKVFELALFGGIRPPAPAVSPTIGD